MQYAKAVTQSRRKVIFKRCAFYIRIDLESIAKTARFPCILRPVPPVTVVAMGQDGAGAEQKGGTYRLHMDHTVHRGNEALWQAWVLGWSPGQRSVTKTSSG